MYRIEYNWTYGDSFSSHTEEGVLLEYEFNTEEEANNALNRIQEHYEWYESKTGYHFSPKDNQKPKWHSTTALKFEVDKGMEYYYLNLIVADGKGGSTEICFWPPWCGYFEILHGASVVHRGEAFNV